MVELKKRLLNTLYIWIASHHSLNVFTYVDFLKYSLFVPFRGSLVYLSCIKVVPLCTYFYKLQLLIK